MSDTVVIVDDSMTVRMDLQEAFEAAGFQTLTCVTAAAARIVFASMPMDVVVLDVLLPDGDGVELLKELRAAPATAATVVLMLSGEAEVADRIRGLRTGADEYVGKPSRTPATPRPPPGPGRTGCGSRPRCGRARSSSTACCPASTARRSSGACAWTPRCAACLACC